MKSIEASLAGTDLLNDLESVQIVSSGQNDAFTRDNTTLLAPPSKSPATTLPFLNLADTAKLADGNNYIWIACTLKADANLDHQVIASCQSVTFSTAMLFVCRSNRHPSDWVSRSDIAAMTT